MSVNKVILLGNLGKDPELRKTQSSLPVCSLSVATKDRRRDANGQWVEQTEWHRVVAFGSTAENCSKYLAKGRQVYVEGRLSTRKWQDQDGKDRYTTEIIANTVQFIGGRGEASQAGEGRIAASGDHGNFGSFSSADNLASNTAEEVMFDDDDIPF